MKKTVKKNGNAIKNFTHRYNVLSRSYKLASFLVIFGVIGLVFLLATKASSPTVNFEAESATLTNCAKQVSDTAAANGKALQFTDCTGSANIFVHPGVVYTQAEIDAWSTSNPEYSKLASSGAASLSKTVWDFGADNVINSAGNPNCTNCDLNTGYKDQSGYAKIQAVLWAADGNTARRDKAVAYLNEYREIGASTNPKPFEDDSAQQYRLVSGWACTNLAQTAEIINYQDASFKSFLRKCYEVMDWTSNPNWHASFADSKLAIAAYLGDATLWSDAKAYFYERIKQSFYHASYDANAKVNPMHSEDNGNATRLHSGAGTPSSSNTVRHWGGQDGVAQINSDYTFKTIYGAPVNGMNAERMRDLGHVNLSLGAWMHAVRTIKAQGEQVEQHAYDRLLTGYSYHGTRVLGYLQTGSVPSPAPLKIDTSPDKLQAWYGARKLFGSATPRSVLDLLNRSDIQGKTAAGTNHLIAEQFTDGP